MANVVTINTTLCKVIDANSSVTELLFCIVTEKLLWAEVDLAPGDTVVNETGTTFALMDFYILMILKPGFLEIWILGTHPRLTDSENVWLRPGIYISIGDSGTAMSMVQHLGTTGT